MLKNPNKYLPLRSTSSFYIRKKLKPKAVMFWMCPLLILSECYDMRPLCIWFMSNKIDSPGSYIWCTLQSEYVTV